MIEVNNLSGGYHGTPIVQQVSFSVRQGELFGILGPNGSGKTTLLKMLSGILSSQQGSVKIKEKSLKQYTAKELAQVVAVLPQILSQEFSYTVKETVALGRYAHQKGLFRTWSEDDEAIVQRVMAQTGVAKFQKHSLHELSGGEKQRVYLAQSLAQQPEILLLDEPTNHLDLSYQKDLLDLLKKMAKECGLTVISIFHDLNLAGLYCDQLLLLEKGKVNKLGHPSEILKEHRINSVYNTNVKKQSHPQIPKPQMSILPEQLQEEMAKIKLNEAWLSQSAEMIRFESPIPMRTLSAGVIGSGWGWHRTFVNRHVDKDYHYENHKEEMGQYLLNNGLDLNETVGMMTAVHLKDVAFQLIEKEDFSVFIVVTAGVGNAVDASFPCRRMTNNNPGTINTWVIVNAHLADEAFVQAIMTATEAKTKALFSKKVKDPVTKTLATGTSTDSVLIAASQRGVHFPYSGTSTELGQVIGQGVYECTIQALEKNRGERR
ncbi:iron complex transport system ATP-binding protein [Oikeobacillus pervagus]|uniref:Iron complex transport system ATP-binding protein n=1 Tax=Oikeobacillus pervagus TaxID=1325931 RepID=A0AAJ1WLP3_9BACI|nr:adenosylcobinamide amidohydrolase [Oikeobacillus pervagus]MDQ0216421.1 iron complex transport system ATP-binding protein [Oikeobacillus pervagus]